MYPQSPSLLCGREGKAGSTSCFAGEESGKGIPSHLPKDAVAIRRAAGRDKLSISESRYLAQATVGFGTTHFPSYGLGFSTVFKTRGYLYGISHLLQINLKQMLPCNRLDEM